MQLIELFLFLLFPVTPIDVHLFPILSKNIELFPHPYLRLHFIKTFSETPTREKITAEAHLVSTSSMPILNFKKIYAEVSNPICHFDEYGNKVCTEPPAPSFPFKYVSPFWLLKDDYKPIANWKNAETGIVLDKQINFADYIRCVEAGLE